MQLRERTIKHRMGRLLLHLGETGKTIELDLIGDVLNEPNESFLLNLANAAKATIESDSRHSYNR